ncbi:MAG: PTS sugar transporter subunit IIA [Candidatus Eisenbacteria bacterium]
MTRSSMSLTELIRANRIQLDVAAEDKSALIRRMVDCLAQSEIVTDPDAVLQALLERERVMSTESAAESLSRTPRAPRSPASRCRWPARRRRSPSNRWMRSRSASSS